MPKVHDRVKLTDRAAQVSDARRGARGGDFNWSERRGVVARAPTRGRVFVLWDGRASPDEWPIEAIEVCDDANG